MVAAVSARTIHFADFTVDLQLKEVRRSGIRLKLPGQPFAVLAMLLERAGEVVTRQEFQSRLWQKETFVDFDHSLNVAVNKLREALGDSVQEPSFIETVPRTGYRFVAPVEVGITAGRGEALAESSGIPTLPPPPPETTSTPPETSAATQPDAPELSTLSIPAEPRPSRVPWYAMAFALVLLCSVGVYAALQMTGHPTGAPPSKVMLAVLPFENLTGDPANEYFSDGVTEEMITHLAALQPNRLGVIARTSVMSYKHGDKSIGRVASQLGVEYVVEGSVRQSQGRVRVTAQLIDVKDQTHLWAQDYDRDLGDMLTMEREVCGDIAREVELQLTPQQRADLAEPRTIDPEAHELYLKGRFFWNKRTMFGYQKSIEYFNGAIERNPNYAEAYAGLADAYRFLMNDRPPDEVMPKARAAAEKALALNPNLAEAHASLGLIAPYFDWDWEGARQHLERALDLNPNLAIVHDWYADGYLSTMGRLDESLAELRVAHRLDPLSLVILVDIGKTLYFARRYDDAIGQFRAVLDMDRNFFLARGWLLKAFLEKGMHEEALEMLSWEKETANRVRYGDYLEDLTSVRGRLGDVTGSRRALAQLLELSQTEHMDPGGAAVAYLALGDKDQAFAWLERAFDAHSNYITSLRVWPEYDPLRSDPRFADLERRAHLIR